LPSNSYTRSRSAPYAPRRVSGPVRRPLPAGAGVRGRTSAFERIARLPDYRLVDRLLRSRACIWLIGILLGGIVAMQVSLLKLNTGISNAYVTQETLEHKNQAIKAQIAELTSGELIRNQAIDLGLVDPDAGNNRFLNSRGADRDAARALKRMQWPSDAAKAVVANHGKTPVEGALAGVPGAVTGQPQTQTGLDTSVANTTPQATPTATPAPPASADPQPTPDATPMATPSPAATDPALAAEG
jgi:hypothetical protein